MNVHQLERIGISCRRQQVVKNFSIKQIVKFATFVYTSRFKVKYDVKIYTFRFLQAIKLRQIFSQRTKSTFAYVPESTITE